MSTAWVDFVCFGCKEWFRVQERDLTKRRAPGHRDRWICLDCRRKLEARGSVERVSKRVGEMEQDASQGRLFDE